MASYIIPIFLILLFVSCFIKNINAYDHFVKGGSEAINLCIKTFPYLVAIFIAVELLQISGISLFLTQLLRPLFTIFGIPSELVEFLIIRPFTGSGSIAMFSELINLYGADGFITKCAAVIMSCSETVFYIVAVYFSTIKIKQLRPTILIALLSCFIGSIIACQICKFV